MVVLGGIYQLNSAFREWAKGYFGDYLACLLETGELPSIGGSVGDSGLCNQFFKPFNLKDGRMLITQTGASTPPSSGSGGGQAAGSRENGGLGSSGYGSYTPVGHFGGASGGGRGRQGVGKAGRSDPNATGNMSASNYGGGYDEQNRKLDTSTKEKLDTQFAFQDEAEAKQKRRNVASASSKTGDSNAGKGRTIIHTKSVKKDAGLSDDSGMNFGDYIRFLIIAAIIIALVLLIGGQMLQIGKSME